MKQYILKAPGQIEAAEEPRTRPVGTQVQVRVSRVGLCGSDIHLYNGSYGGPHSYPMLFGHEWAGVVSAVGEGVRNFDVGDVVTGDCSKYCGICEGCQTDKNLCRHIEKFGITVDGASAEYILRDEKYLYKAAEGMDEKLLCLAEPLAVSAHLIERVRSVLNGGFQNKRVLILGGGVIGMGVGMLLKKVEDCPQVELYDLSESRTAIAEKNGMRIPEAAELVPCCGDDYASMYAFAKYDVVLETTGVATVFVNALHLVKSGGVLGCVGMISGVEIPQKLIVTKALTIVGSIGGTGNFDTAMRFVCRFPRCAKDLISHFIPIAEVSRAFETARDPQKSMKVVLEL